MAHGIYTAERRVVRDGRLVCFAGEKMTLDEAARRGLAGQAAAPAPAQAAPAPGDAGARLAELMAMSADGLRSLAESVGAEVANGATKARMAEAIVAKEQA